MVFSAAVWRTEQAGGGRKEERGGWRREEAGGGRRPEEVGGWRREEGGACLHTEEERHMGRGRWSSKVLCSLAPARGPGKSLWVLAREPVKSI